MRMLELGDIVKSQKIIDKMVSDKSFAEFITKSIERYGRCDWGDSSLIAKDKNDDALRDRYDIKSSYESKEYPRILIKTSWNRLKTNILFASEE